jgi:multicomponent Na+:H+ antiporter subunit G
VALVLFLLLTAPVSAHMIGQASYFSPDYIGGAIWEGTIVDRRVEHHSVEEGASSDELGDPAA